MHSKKRYVKYTPSKIVEEAKKHGAGYILKKYGQSVYHKMLGRINDAVKQGRKHHPRPGRPPTTGGTTPNTPPAKNSSYKSGATRHSTHGPGNAPPKAHGLFKAAAGRMKDGGPSDPSPQFKRQMNFNLSNDEDVAQGSEHQWATPTSISHLISGQLRQAANAGVDYWDAWAQDKAGTTTLSNRSGSPFGTDASFSVGPSSQLAASNPMGAFGTSAVMNDYGNQEFMEMEEAEEMIITTPDGVSTYKGPVNTSNPFPTVFGGWDGTGDFKNNQDSENWMAYDPDGYLQASSDGIEAYDKLMEDNVYSKWNDRDRTFNGIKISETAFEETERYWMEKAEKAQTQITMQAYTNFYNTQVGSGNTQMTYDPKKGVTGWGPAAASTGGTGTGTGGTGTPATGIPNIDTGGPVVPTDMDIFGAAAGEVYNPWSRLQGGNMNAMGPNSQTLAQGTMEAMNLANAYFAPQRAELAYELGDMETDMRRMAVNLGRQVDDPILQAKLYKEAARSVRTMDIQQNTLAFQMADQRRKEDIANWQFYDQLAAQEAQLKLANRQFYDKFGLDKRYYNLENAMASHTISQGGTLAGAGQAPPSAGEQSYGNLVNGYKSF